MIYHKLGGNLIKLQSEPEDQTIEKNTPAQFQTNLQGTGTFLN